MTCSRLRCNINSKETCGTGCVLAMEAADNCINLNVQWGLCQLVYIATLVCFVSAIGFSPCSHIPASQQPTQGNKNQKIQIFGPLLYFCPAAERFVSCFLHILECRVGWHNYPNLEFLCNNLQAFPHMCQKHNRAYNNTFTGVTVAFLVWFDFVCLIIVNSCHCNFILNFHHLHT